MCERQNDTNKCCLCHSVFRTCINFLVYSCPTFLSQSANKVLEKKKQRRKSVPNFKTKAFAVRKLKEEEKCENEHREKAIFVYNFVQKTNATERLWWHCLYDNSAKDKSANDTSAKPTVRMPTVRKGQQCEWDKSANVKCANANSAMRHRCEKKCDSSANDNSAKRTLCRDMHALLYRQKPEFWDRQSHFSPLM